MKNFSNFFGVIALVAVFGFLVMSCKEEDDGKTLVITGISDIQKNTEGTYGFIVGLFPVGTKDNDAKNRVVLPVAYGEYYDVPSGSSNNWTVTVPLLNASNNQRWTGSGDYMVGFECYSNSYTCVYYKFGNVSFSEATTTLSATNAVKVP